MEKYFGLSSQQVLENQKKFGPNELSKKRKVTIFWRFIQKLLNPMVIILIFAATLSFFLGQKSDFLVILAIIVLSLSLDVYQEHFAENAVEKLVQKIAYTARVIRNGKVTEILSKEITIDDIILLETGNIVPADAKLLEVNSLQVDQSALTGESFPQQKDIENNNEIWAGTIIVAGTATAKVTKISTKTEFGKISSELISKRPATEFEIGINKFAYLLVTATAIFGVGILFVSTLILHHEILGTLLFVLALAIGFAPELLPMILTINLSRGAINLSKKDVIVKFLPAIENFGSMDVLCTDKTGTLTENKTTLVSFCDDSGKKKEEVLFFGFLNSFFQTGYKNPLDDAVLAIKTINGKGFEKIAEIPFDFFRKRQSVILKQNGKTILITKGNTGSILSISKNEQLKKDKVEKLLTSFADKGMRVISVAIKEIKKPKEKYLPSDEKDLEFLGLLAFMDPPKESAGEALLSLKAAGVTTKILTGDNEQVAQHVWSKLNLPPTKTFLGSDLEKMNETEFSAAVEEANIFAQINPGIKEKIVFALKKNGHVVGFLGDGINDAPSLRAADIGISVNNAVDIAKESADLILLKKDLGVLHSGIIEGRKIFANILKYIVMGTSSTFGNMVSLAFSSLIVPFLPLLPTQVLLNDLLYDSSQMLLVNDNVDKTAIAKPRKWNISFIREYTLVFGAVSSLFDLLTFGLLIFLFRADPATFRTGWFLESIITQTLIIFVIRTTKVPFFKSKTSLSFGLSLIGIVVVAILLPFLPLGSAFHFVRPPMLFFAVLFGILTSYFIFTEVTKIWFYKKFRQ